MNLQADMQPDMAGSLAGFRLYPGHFDRAGQVELLADVRAVLQTAPLFTPRMPKSGRPFSVRMSNCGPLGWVSDEGGYRYQPSHPETGKPWPPIPPTLMALWRALARFGHPPEACLINFMARMQRWACIRIATNWNSMPRSSRFRSAIPVCSGSAGASVTTLRALSG
jgi:alkylated DNA repair dioxygenase AlkB